MTTFQEALYSYFSFWHDIETDNLPVRAAAKYRRGKEGDFGRNALARMVRDMGLNEGVEIGTHRGFSAAMWCRTNKDLHLTCIDPYKSYQARPMQSKLDKTYKEASMRLRRCNATILRTSSLEAVDRFEDGSLGFVFIDGDHRFDAVVQDLVRWAPKVREGGLVMLHDYCSYERAGVMHAVDSYTHCHRIDPWFVTRDNWPTVFWERGAERSR